MRRAFTLQLAGGGRAGFGVWCNSCGTWLCLGELDSWASEARAQLVAEHFAHSVDLHRTHTVRVRVRPRLMT